MGGGLGDVSFNPASPIIHALCLFSSHPCLQNMEDYDLIGLYVYFKMLDFEYSYSLLHTSKIFRLFCQVTPGKPPFSGF